jgi:two-component system sensor histidine kinase HydH
MVSVGLALLSFAVLSAFVVVIVRGMNERTALESRSDGEQTINQLFASLRNFDDFGTAIENMPSLRQKVIGVGVFAKNGDRLYAWGEVPAASPAVTFRGTVQTDRMAYMYIENARSSSTIILLRPSDEGPPPAPPADRPARAGHSFMFDTLRKASLIYLEIHQPTYWRDKRVLAVLFPVVEVLLAALVVFVRFLILRNSEYRNRIEQQKNLVMLGTAASTLAHEIKNPLLAIRLQTSILARTLAGQGSREIGIIDDEVSRLSMLSHRVTDILRDPAGNSQNVDVAEIAHEVASRLCGRTLVTATTAAPHVARIDPERLRSILENLLRNALESGSREDAVAIEITGENGKILIDVLDRGSGIPPRDRERVFDPFFTTKSRGSGIGLTICRRFALAAAGSITLESRASGGSRARLVLPACPAARNAGGKS